MQTEKLDVEVDEDLLDPNTDARAAVAEQELGMIRTPLREVSKRDARKAAEELGLSKISVDKLGAQAVLGRYIEQAGAIRITTGEFMVSNSVRDELIQLCLERVRDKPSLKTLMQVGAFLNKLLESKDNALKIINQAQSLGMIKPAQDPPRTNLPPRGAQITPVQINNSNVTIGPKPQ